MNAHGINILAKLHQSQNDAERHEETSIARALLEQHPQDFSTWGAALAAAAEIIRSRRR